jgi:hypothetical protein
VSAQLEQRGDEQLVAVRPNVLSDVEHAVGNLLQRMHHCARAATGGLGVQGERLQGALDDLERLLELLFDYVTPVELEVKPIEASRLAESLAAQLRGQGVAEVGSGAVPAILVLADPRVVSRSFLLLAQACVRDGEQVPPLTIDIIHDPAGERVQFVVQAAADIPVMATAHASLAAAVAERLIELQGGELQAWPRPTCLCVVALPAAS